MFDVLFDLFACVLNVLFCFLYPCCYAVAMMEDVNPPMQSMLCAAVNIFAMPFVVVENRLFVCDDCMCDVRQ